MQARLFVDVHGDGEGGLHALATDDAGETKTDIGQAADTMQFAAQGQDSLFVVEDGFKDVGDGEADGVVGCAFAEDDLIGCLFDVAEDVIFVGGGDAAVVGNRPLRERDGAD